MDLMMTRRAPSYGPERRARVDRLLRQAAEHFGAGLRHARIRLGVSGQRRPAALAHIGALFPRIADGLQLPEVFIGILGVPEVVHADRRKRGDDRLFGLLACELRGLA